MCSINDGSRRILALTISTRVSAAAGPAGSMATGGAAAADPGAGVFDLLPSEPQDIRKSTAANERARRMVIPGQLVLDSQVVFHRKHAGDAIGLDIRDILVRFI